MTTSTPGDESTDAAAARHSRHLRHNLVRRLQGDVQGGDVQGGIVQDRAPVPHAEVLAAAWNAAARSRHSRLPADAAAPRDP